MKVVVLQFDIEWAAPSVNIRMVEQLMNAQSADLYVLPEMWATGFVTDPSAVAKPEGETEALTWMQSTARSRRCALCGSLAVVDDQGHYRNRHYFVTPDQTVAYDKRHLFSYGGEDRYYRHGTRAVIAEYGGLRFLLQTCYDLRFPVFSRYGIAGCYDAIIYVASWPRKRIEAWNTLLRARAIENQCYVVACNRVGADPVTDYSGGSCIIDPIGRTMAACREGGVDACSAELTQEEVSRRREHFAVLADRDEFVGCIATTN